MRPKKYCPKFYPWTTTSRGERSEVCVDRERLEIKDCDCCIDRKTNEQKTPSMKKSKSEEIPPHGHTLCAYNDKGNCQIFEGLDCPMNFFEPDRMCSDGKIGTLEHSLANYNHDYTVATGKEPPVSEGLAMWMVLFNTKKQ